MSGLSGYYKQAELSFAATYSVVHLYTDVSGISANVFRDIEGKSCLAIRGTESPGDIIPNYILTMGFPSYLNPQFIQLQTGTHRRRFRDCCVSP